MAPNNEERIQLEKYEIPQEAFRVPEVEKMYNEIADKYWPDLSKYNKAQLRSLAIIAKPLKKACEKKGSLYIPCENPRVIVVEPEIDFQTNKPNRSVYVFAIGENKEEAAAEAKKIMSTLLKVQQSLFDCYVLTEENKPRIMTAMDVSEDQINKLYRELFSEEAKG
jgi:predicted RNA-binding protein YlxR (DUF448 family)